MSMSLWYFSPGALSFCIASYNHHQRIALVVRVVAAVLELAIEQYQNAAKTVLVAAVLVVAAAAVEFVATSRGSSAAGGDGGTAAD